MTKEELEAEKVRADIAHIRILADKMAAEREKIMTENTLYPYVVASSLTLAIVAVAKVFL